MKEFIKRFHEFPVPGLAHYEGNASIVINAAAGKIIQRPKFDFIYTRNDKGLIKVEKDKKLGYLNIKGVIVVAPRYSSIEPERDGLIKVEINKKYGFLNAETLQEVTECIYDHIYDLEDGKYKVGIGRKIGYLNADGSVSQVPQ